MVVISQIWIQHIPCTCFIGYSHLRIGSAKDPSLASALYTTLSSALESTKSSEDKYSVTSIYAFGKQTEGFGLFSVQSNEYRLICLCEGVFQKGIPNLKQSFDVFKALLDNLAKKIPSYDCEQGHLDFSRDENFWFDLIVSSGIAKQFNFEEFEFIYPMKSLEINYTPTTNIEDVVIESLEKSSFGALGYGWQHTDDIIERRIQNVYLDTKFNILIFDALFKQFEELTDDFKPQNLVMVFDNWNKESDDSMNTLTAFITRSNSKMKIVYSLPFVHDIEMQGMHSVKNYLRTFHLEF